MTSSSTEAVESAVLVKKDGAIATITLNRPKAMNSLNLDLVDAALAAIADVKADDTIKVVVLTGNGRAFSAGGDLFYLLSLKELTAARSFIEKAGGISAALLDLPKPVIAMVNGVAAGAGFSLTLASDVVFCAKSVKFAMSFSKVGLVPDCGAHYLLPRSVGPHVAKELMFTADLISAEEAYRIGVVNHLVEDEKLPEVTYAFAKRLLKSAPLALTMIKKTVNMSGMIDLPTTLEIETECQTVCMRTADHQEGVAAFKEKRDPVFAGR